MPFRKTIGPILKEQIEIELHDSTYGNVWSGISNGGADQIRRWMDNQGDRVFLRDLLDLSIALANRYGSTGSSSVVYSLESSAKYKADPVAISKIVDMLSTTITELPFYRDAEVVSCVPPRPSKEFDLPSVLADQVATRTGKQRLPAGAWAGEKGQLKDVAVGEKWDRLEHAGFAANSQISGKTVILIDDLYQSGCTLHFVASKLRTMGATRIFGLCVIKSGRNTDNQ